MPQAWPALCHGRALGGRFAADRSQRCTTEVTGIVPGARGELAEILRELVANDADSAIESGALGVVERAQQPLPAAPRGLFGPAKREPAPAAMMTSVFDITASTIHMPTRREALKHIGLATTGLAFSNGILRVRLDIMSPDRLGIAISSVSPSVVRVKVRPIWRARAPIPWTVRWSKEWTRTRADPPSSANFLTFCPGGGLGQRPSNDSRLDPARPPAGFRSPMFSGSTTRRQA